MKELRRIFRRCIAATLCCAMLLQSTCVYAAGDENSVSYTADTSAPSVKTYENNGTEVEVSDDSTDSSINKNDNAADNGASDSTDNVTSDGTDNSMSEDNRAASRFMPAGCINYFRASFYTFLLYALCTVQYVSSSHHIFRCMFLEPRLLPVHTD